MTRARGRLLYAVGSVMLACASLDGLSGGGRTDSGIDASASDASGDAAPTPDADACAPRGGAYRAAVLADSPLAFWRLDDRSTATSCKNEVAGSYVALYSGAPQLQQPGIFCDNAAMRFDGTTAISVIGRADAEPLDFPHRAAFAVEAWLAVDSVDAGYPSLAMDLYADPTPSVGYTLFATTDLRMRMERWSNHAVWAVALSEPNAIAIGTFAHVVYSSDGARAVLYVNAVPYPDMEIDPDADIPEANASFRWANQLHGVLDELALYDHPLAADRVLAHYMAAAR